MTTEKKRSKLVSEPNYHTTKHFFGKYVSDRNEKDKRNNE